MLTRDELQSDLPSRRYQGKHTILFKPLSRNKGKHYKRNFCRVCEREMPVMPDGKIGRHGTGQRFSLCAGSYKLPKGVSLI